MKNYTIPEECRRLHTSKRQGYVSRKNPEGIIVPYKGKYGEGFVLKTPRWDTTRFCDWTYFIR